MQIVELHIENIKSFVENVIINFNEGLNVFIGPNAGGKSNFMETLSAIFNNYLINTWSKYYDKNTRKNILRKSDFKIPIIKSKEKNNDPQIIKLVLEIKKNDIDILENIKNIINILIDFEKSEFGSSHLNQYKIHDFLDSLDLNLLLNKKVEYIIKDNHVQPYSDDISKLFMTFLNCSEILSLLMKEYKLKNPKKDLKYIYPSMLYFTPYRMFNGSELTVRLSEDNEQELINQMKNLKSRNSYSVLNFAKFKLGRIFRENEENKFKFDNDKRVKLLNKYLKILDFSPIDINIDNINTNDYEIILKYENGLNCELQKCSSGEIELLNFLFGIILYDINNGLIIIDEPEIHLHPRWQKILFTLFRDLSNDNKIQFVIVTHSPQFVNYNTTKNTFRVYKNENNYSKIINPNFDSIDTRKIFRIVNALNNEKMFFSDEVILVEGSTDKIIIESILKKIESKTPNKIIEIIDVTGKSEFKKFRDFLDRLKIKNYILADIDYLYTIDSSSHKFFKNDKEIKDPLINTEEIELSELKNSHKLNNIIFFEKDLEYFFKHKGFHSNIDSLGVKRKIKIHDAIDLSTEINEDNSILLEKIPKDLKVIIEEIIR